MEPSHLFAGLLTYIVAGRLVMRRLTGVVREAALAALNVGGVFFFLFYGNKEHFALRFGIYLALIVGLYLTVRLFSEKRGGWPWLAFSAPIAALIVVRYVPGSMYVALGNALGKSWHSAPTMVGISYLAFRCSRLVLEVRNGEMKKPSFLEYLNFAFFLPTMPVGPINTYANFRRGFAAERYDVPMGRATLRILVGAVKYQFLGNLCNQLGYASLLLDDHPHPWMDLPVAMVFYYLFLYCNFSGFCDIAIGAAGLMGIAVPENFDHPLAARNMKEFWNRWHITLSQYMRDMVFSPLSKFLVRNMGVPMADHAIALTIAVVFLLVGIWHGAGWNFVAFGAAQSVGVVVVHYYTIFLKKRLGRDGYKKYNDNRWIRAAAVPLTFCYFAASLIFFACTFDQIREILAVLKP
jgi:D-alanyl-lipoteichoic acid acyltransferase DltB (MBOAT superfamily)